MEPKPQNSKQDESHQLEARCAIHHLELVEVVLVLMYQNR
jgi:hypothetical protein